MTCVQPASFSISGETSPVNAPSRAKCMFWPPTFDRGALQGLGHRGERGRRGEHHHLGIGRAAAPRRSRAPARLPRRPSCSSSSCPRSGSRRLTDPRRQATPGSGSPARNSSEAPPPVETWSIRSARPICLTAATLSPPPTTVVAVAARPARSAIAPRPRGERLHLEHAHRAVPQDRPRVARPRRRRARSSGADVEAHPSRRAPGRPAGSGARVLLERLGHDVVDRKRRILPAASRHEQAARRAPACRPRRGSCPSLRAPAREEGVGHAAADEQRVHPRRAGSR